MPVEDKVEVRLVTTNAVIRMVMVVCKRKTIMDVGASVIIIRDVATTTTQTPAVVNDSAVILGVIAPSILKAFIIGRIALGTSMGGITNPIF